VVLRLPLLQPQLEKMARLASAGDREAI